MKSRFFFLIILCLLGDKLLAQKGREIPEITWEQSYHIPEPPENKSGWGEHIQRSMHLLASSTPDSRNTVRILFYGQSIVANKLWTDAVVADLKKRFPHANIVYENRAIGGFSAQYLVQSAEADLYPFYPDLLVFHVFGSHKEYQEIIHNTRNRTTAEIAIVTDHLGSKEYDGKQFQSPGDWKEFKRKTFVPLVAKEYDAQLINITDPWKKYLVKYELTSQDLLKDGIHPNDHGCFLMSQLVQRELIYLPEQKPEEPYDDMVTYYEIGKDIEFQEGKLIVPFIGNKVDLIAANNDSNVRLSIQIDYKKPSEFIDAYYHGRSSGCPAVSWPAVLHVDAKTLPLPEEWNLIVTKIRKANTDFDFKVKGSKTGFDGTGTSLKKFVSNSGRVIIEPKAWMNLERDRKHKDVPMKEGFEITWQTKVLFTDTYEKPEITDNNIENATTVIQNIANGKHQLQLEIIDGEKAAIKAIKVYHPPMQSGMKVVANPPIN